jgi:2-haloacid dehalogenase
MIDTVIFDLGNVLIKWDPTVVYKDYFQTENELNHFFQTICTLEWNEEQDKGRSVKEATESLIDEHPSYEEAIRMYYGRWTEMILGAMDGTPDILRSIHAKNEQRLFALTNWSAELFPYALDNFDFLSLFEGILVSGEEKMKKPDLEIYRRFEEKFPINRANCVFIDDSQRNIKGAQDAGWNTIHFKSATQLKGDLKKLGIEL